MKEYKSTRPDGYRTLESFGALQDLSYLKYNNMEPQHISGWTWDPSIAVARECLVGTLAL